MNIRNHHNIFILEVDEFCGFNVGISHPHQNKPNTATELHLRIQTTKTNNRFNFEYLTERN